MFRLKSIRMINERIEFLKKTLVGYDLAEYELSQRLDELYYIRRCLIKGHLIK